MATLPSASVSISATAGALAGGTGYCVVIAPVGTNADSIARVYSSARSLLAQHNYAPGVDYAADHIESTGKPVIFVGIPIATAGAIGSINPSGVTGTSAITISGTPLEEVDAIITVTTGGTIGTSGIKFMISMDGGTTEKAINLGTASSYTVPYLGIVIDFAAGTLERLDVYTFLTTAPMWDNAGLVLAKASLVAQQKLARSWYIAGDVATSTIAGYVTTAINGYETSNARFAYARVNVIDRLPQPRKSKVDAQTLTFAEVGATGDTITRSAGSWIADGFKVGDNFTITGSVLNNITTTGGIAAISSTVITLGTDDLVAEVVASNIVTMGGTQTMAAWVADKDADFASVDAKKRLDIGIGRGRKLSPITGWSLRRPAAWHASIREYQHDIHIPTWRKEDGPLDGVSLENAAGTIVEFDERTDGGALAARFTCLRTWGNGPNGAYVAMSLTRDTEGSLLSYTHNMAVANVGCTIVQSTTENIIGKVLVLNADGTAKAAALQVIEEAVNTDLQQALMKEHVPGEGPRASLAVWRASTDDVLNVPDATVTGVLDLRLNGTIVHVTTVVKVS